MSEKFKITNIGIDVSEVNKPISKQDINNIKYIHTSISSGNESFINFTIDDTDVLITTIDFLDKSDVAIANHLEELGKKSIDLLLIDSNCKIEDNVDLINNLIISGLVNEIGISQPESLKRLEEISKVIPEILHISLNICPLNFPWSIIKYCFDNNIKIIGFNPFGGKFNSTRLINGFSVPYLLSFISAYSDIVFLSGRNLDAIESECVYLDELIDKEYGKEFTMSQDINKLLKEPKKTIYTSIKLDEDLILPFDADDSIFSYPELVFSVGKPKIVLPESQEKNELISLVYDYNDTFDNGPSDNPTPKNTISILKHQVLNLAMLHYPSIDGWNVFSTKISDLLFVISSVRKTQEKKFLRKSKESIEQNDYTLYYDGTKFIFQKLKNAEI